MSVAYEYPKPAAEAPATPSPQAMAERIQDLACTYAERVDELRRIVDQAVVAAAAFDEAYDDLAKAAAGLLTEDRPAICLPYVWVSGNKQACVLTSDNKGRITVQMIPRID